MVSRDWRTRSILFKGSLFLCYDFGGQQDMRSEGEGLRDGSNGRERDVAFATLDPPDVGSVNASKLGQLFLRQSESLPMRTNVRSHQGLEGRLCPVVGRLVRHRDV